MSAFGATPNLRFMMEYLTLNLCQKTTGLTHTGEDSHCFVLGCKSSASALLHSFFTMSALSADLGTNRAGKGSGMHTNPWVSLSWSGSTG